MATWRKPALGPKRRERGLSAAWRLSRPAGRVLALERSLSEALLHA